MKVKKPILKQTELVALEGTCQECGREFKGRNAAGNAAIHTRTHRHVAVATTTLQTTYSPVPEGDEK